MNYIVITDIFGNRISEKDNINRLPFILLHTSQPHLLMDRIGDNRKKKSTIWKLKYPTIMHTLYLNQIPSSKFAPLGDIWYPKNKLPQSEEIILVNTELEISRYPIDYAKVDEYDGLNVWRPISQRGFRALGYVVSKKKPSIRTLRTVNDKLLTNFNEKKRVSENRIINMNEFKLLGHSNDKKYTVDRTKVFDKDFLVRLKSQNGYLTREKNKVKLNDDRSGNQAVNYTVQGELKMGNKCLSVMNNDTEDSYVYLDDCKKNDKQKWYPYLSHFVSQYNGSCLKSKKDEVELDDCKDNKDQIWTTESLRTVVHDRNQKDNKPWETKYGKRVVLIEPENPWYIERGIEKEPEGIISQEHKPLNQVDYRGNADVYDKFVMDISNPSMGYGYSLAQRKGQPCSCAENCNKIPKKDYLFENFEEDNESKQNEGFINFNLIASILFAVVLGIVSIRLYSYMRK